MHAVPASLKGKYVIRFTVTSPRTTVEDITRDWYLIRDTATELAGGEVVPARTRIPLKRKFLCPLLKKMSRKVIEIIQKLLNANERYIFYRNKGTESALWNKFIVGQHWNK